MNDMSLTIVAKSDQINAADLIGVSRTISIKEVRIKAGEDQPVSVLIEGDRKVFRPCKGVRRLMMRVWGPDANKYIGQSMTIFCDPTVTWAGKEEGGIRVSHMSGLHEKIIEFMRVSRAATKPYEILPLRQATQKAPDQDAAEEWANAHIAKLEAATILADAEQIQATASRHLARMADQFPALHRRIDDAYRTALVDLASEGRADEDMGEAGSELFTRVASMIEDATDKPSWDEADLEFQAFSASMSDPEADRIEAMLAAKKRALAGAAA